MKANHKNRPIEVVECTLLEALKKIIEWQIWAETQERELRERLLSLNKSDPRYYFIEEELLGEEPKHIKKIKVAD